MYVPRKWRPQVFKAFLCQAEAKARLKVARKVSQEAAEEAGSRATSCYSYLTIRVHTQKINKHQILVLHHEAKANAAEEAKREAAEQVGMGLWGG